MATWDPTRQGSGIVLSNVNLTATDPPGTSSLGFATNPHSVGRWTYSAVFPSIGASGVNIGLGTTSASTSGFLGQDTQTFAWFSNNGLLRIGSGIGAAAPYNAGDTLAIAVDLTAKLIWVLVNSGNWNNTVGANPDTNTSGVSISTIASLTLSPAFSFATANDQVTANFGTASGLSTFTPWNGPQILLPARPLHRAVRAGDNVYQGTLALDWNNGLLATSTNPTPASIGPFDSVNDRVVTIAADADGWVSVGGTAGVATAGSSLVKTAAPPSQVYVPAGVSLSFVAASGTAHLSAIPAIFQTGG